MGETPSTDEMPVNNEDRTEDSEIFEQQISVRIRLDRH